MPADLYRINHTRAECFRRCRKQFWFRYVSGQEWPEPVQTPPGVIGTGIHKAMRTLTETGEPDLGAQELEAYLRMPIHECAGPGTEAYGVALEIYRAGCQAHESIPSLDSSAELDTWVPRPRDGITLQARIDRADHLPDGAWQVIDWKTGLRDRDDATDAQLDLGHVAIRTVRRLPREAEVTAIAWNLRTGRKRVRQLNRADAVATVEKMVRLAAAMQRETDFAASPGPHCTFCDFRPRCPDAAYIEAGDLDWLDEPDFDPPDLEAPEEP